MKFLKGLGNALFSRAGTYTFFILSVFALIFLRSATWTYGWIAELYPLGSNFIPTVTGISIACIVVIFAYLLLLAFSAGKKVSGMTAFKVI